MNSSQSGWPKSWCPRSSFQRSSGSGSVTPSASACGTRHVDELLPQLVVGVALDPPRHRLRGVGRVGVGRAEHHQRRPPEPVDRLLHHRALLVGAAHHRHQQLEALPLVEGLLLADPDHRPAVGAVRRPAQRHLVADRGAVDQPADGADVGVRQRRVVEDRGVLLPALDEHLGELAAARRRASRTRSRGRARGRPRPAPWPAGSPCGAATGARVIQLPSGCMPMISECACWAIWRTSVLR